MRTYAYVAAIVAFSTVLPMFMQSASIARIGASRPVLIGTIGLVLAGALLVSRSSAPTGSRR